VANYVDEVLASIDGVSAGLVSAIYGGFSAEFGVIIPTILTILGMIFGISIMTGFVDYPIKEFIKRLFAVTAVFTLIFNWEWFNLLFYGMFTNAPDAIGGIILDAAGFDTPGGMGTKLGELFEMGIIASGAGFSSDGWVMPIVLGVAIFLSTLLVCGFAIALLCLAKVGTAVVLSLGPLFIFFTLFSSTRRMFSSWLQQLFNYGFISVLTFIIMAFLMQLIEQGILAIPSEEPTVAHITPLVLVSFIGCFVFWQVPQTAAGLASGAQLTTLGAFSSAANTLRRSETRKAISNFASSGANATGRALRSTYERARRGSIRRQ
jgi:type IV secretion system protein VirB6